MKRFLSRLRRPLRNERGEITFFACFFVVGVVMLISFLLLYASVRITCINIRNGAKMELNNLSATIYADTYGIYFAITYGYNAYFWDNGIANNLFFSVAIWWLFCAWVICLIVLFSSLLQNNTGVALCIGGTVLLAYLLSVIPKVKVYSPIVLMNTNSLLTGEAEIDAYIKAIVVAVSLCIVCVAVSIPIINKRQL